MSISLMPGPNLTNVFSGLCSNILFIPLRNLKGVGCGTGQECLLCIVFLQHCIPQRMQCAPVFELHLFNYFLNQKKKKRITANKTY